MVAVVVVDIVTAIVFIIACFSIFDIIVAVGIAFAIIAIASAIAVAIAAAIAIVIAIVIVIIIPPFECPVSAGSLLWIESSKCSLCSSKPSTTLLSKILQRCGGHIGRILVLAAFMSHAFLLS